MVCISLFRWLLSGLLLLRVVLLPLILENSGFWSEKSSATHSLVYFQTYILNVQYVLCFKKWRNPQKRKTQRLINCRGRVLLLHGLRNLVYKLILLSWLTHWKAFWTSVINFNWKRWLQKTVKPISIFLSPRILPLHFSFFYNWGILGITWRSSG